jgi:hypothetical protein
VLVVVVVGWVVVVVVVCWVVVVDGVGWVVVVVVGPVVVDVVDVVVGQGWVRWQEPLVGRACAAGARAVP